MGKPPRHRNSPNPAGKAAAAAVAHRSSPRGIASSSSSTGSAPSSVMCVPASPLARELSDLSGSYMNGNTAPRSSANRSFGNSVCSTEEPVQGFWRQAHILSPPCPREAPTPTNHPNASTAVLPSATSALIVVERNGVIELVKKSDTTDAGSGEDHNEQPSDEDQQVKEPNALPGAGGGPGIHVDDDDLMFLSNNSPAALLLKNNEKLNSDATDLAASDESSRRIPLLILLLDPGRKQYELMQLWVDPQADLVRDVLHALQRKLSDKWRQDYDGLFQLRGNQYCQLVHILSLAKYDVRPRELWVAKPWSMAAKSTIELANDCIRQLRAGGLLAIYTANSPGKSRIKNFLRKGSNNGRSSPASVEEDGPLTLSDEALKRIYVPDGVMKHHHACQFLSFRVPAIPSRVVGNTSTNSQSKGFLGSLLGTSQSFDDVSSQLSNPSDAMLLPIGETTSKLNSSSSTASPGSGHRYRQQHHGYGHSHNHRQQRLPDFNSKWHPSGTLEVVGEVIVNSNPNESTHKEKQVQTAANVSTILADLETSDKRSDLNHQHQHHSKDRQQQQQLYEQDSENESKKQHRCSLWSILAPLNCTRRRGASRKGDDGYSSSWGGDASSSAKHSGSKNSGSKNSGSNHNNNDGRETPTSKGSGDGDDAFQNNDEVAFTWAKGSSGDADTSIVSDSAPLLSRREPETSRNKYSVPEQPQAEASLSVVIRPTSFSRYSGKT